MKIKVLLLALVVNLSATGQGKPIIDTGMLNLWPNLSKYACLSQNGRFAAYLLENRPLGYKTLVIQDIKSDWKKELVGADFKSTFYFTKDDKHLCWQKGDSLYLQATGRKNFLLLSVVASYFYPNRNKGEWIAYRKKDSSEQLRVLNLVSGKCFKFNDVIDGVFEENGKVLLLFGGKKIKTLKWVDLKENKSVIIWSGGQNSKVSNFKFDKSGKQLAFKGEDSTNSAIYVYKGLNYGVAERVVDFSSLKMEGFKDCRINEFSTNGKKLFTKIIVSRPQLIKPDKRMVSVDVWSYRDEILQPQQILNKSSGLSVKNYDWVVNLDSNKSGLLLNPDGLSLRAYTDDYAILTSDTLHREYWWPHKIRPSEWLISLKDGTRHPLLKEHDQIQYLSFSPYGRWITWWDAKNATWFSYEIATGITRNLSQFVPTILASNTEYVASNLSRPVAPVAGWYKNDSSLLIYDNYDIWKIDPACNSRPINITDSYGQQNKIELRLLFERDYLGIPYVYNGNESLFVVGFSQRTKYNGFYNVKINRSEKPQLLSMGPFSYYRLPSQSFPIGIEPIRCGGCKNNGWLLTRQSASDFTNFYYTKDFVEFKAITTLAPQKAYNWLTSELITWNLPDGRECQGVLYKPENFDSTIKYPVIFNYYEKKSYDLFTFLMPGLTNGNINIPWFVSRGYLVFTPDIYYGNGSKTGMSSGKYALNSVESAVEILCKRPYIDKARLGLQGHSFGGLETNYILTHSNLFAAAAENAGFSDVLSSYLTLTGDGVLNPLDLISTQEHKEMDHELYGSNPWLERDIYIDNSAVWFADKASAPLLIFHNKNDEQVQWRQGVEMYMALRRLGKPCWMLQYDNSSHLLRSKDGLDYTIRLTQFFDHYLKENLAPMWMTQGVPAEFKQVEYRYDLDNKGSCYDQCKICKKLITFGKVK
jgi:dienelactone hydrolase